MTYLLHSVLHPVTKTSRHQTTVKWRTQSPDFHEQFVYNSGSVDHLAKQSLHLTVWDRERGRPDEYIGEHKDIPQMMAPKTTLGWLLFLLSDKSFQPERYEALTRLKNLIGGDTIVHTRQN